MDSDTARTTTQREQRHGANNDTARTTTQREQRHGNGTDTGGADSDGGTDNGTGYGQRRRLRTTAPATDNGTLLCGYHHRNFEAIGWTVNIIDGLPWWTPPTWLDPAQQPVRNTAHDHCNG
jgi:hypothetical protein